MIQNKKSNAPKKKLAHLHELADAVTAERISEIKIKQLNKAFKLFKEETKRIETAYSALKAEYKKLNLQLEAKNTELNQKVNELNFATHYLDSILMNISQGILFIDLQGNITTYNAEAERILGKSKDDVLFNSFWKLFDDNVFGFSLRKALKLRLVPSLSYIKLKSANEKTRDIEVEVNFILKKEAKKKTSAFEGMIILIKDMTDINKLRLLAQRNDRMKELGEMAAKVAHEIRNPLGGIKGFAALLARDLADKPEQRQLAKYIVEGTDTISRLVTNVLNYARPVHLEPTTIDLKKMLTDFYKYLVADKNKAKNINIKFVTKEKICLASIDIQLIKLCLLNLVVNAMEAMPKGGTLKLGLIRNENEAVISVADTGEGISSENSEKIFSPFFTTKVRGNGFGLAEVHKVITAHNGNIVVVSSEGKGSTFSIHLPLYTSQFKNL